jgi:hypothetical protein
MHFYHINNIVILKEKLRHVGASIGLQRVDG